MNILRLSQLDTFYNIKQNFWQNVTLIFLTLHFHAFFFFH